MSLRAFYNKPSFIQKLLNLMPSLIWNAVKTLQSLEQPLCEPHSHSSWSKHSAHPKALKNPTLVPLVDTFE